MQKTVQNVTRKPKALNKLLYHCQADKYANKGGSISQQRKFSLVCRGGNSKQFTNKPVTSQSSGEVNYNQLNAQKNSSLVPQRPCSFSSRITRPASNINCATGQSKN